MSSVSVASPAPARTTDIAHHLIFATWGALTLILLLPAVWNGFPLVFDDVGGYLDRWPSGELGNGRSAVYGLLLWITAPYFWITAIALQAIAATWVAHCAVTIYAGKQSIILSVSAAALIIASGAPLLMSQVMPDAWAGPALLAFGLLAMSPRQLSIRQKTGLASIVAFAAASHMATFGLLAGMAALSIILRFAAPGLTRPRGWLLAAASVVAGISLLICVDFIVAGRAVVTPGGQIFFFGRLMESGLVGKTLSRECPRPDWRFCDYKDQMPATADEMLWDGDSPLYKLGGWDSPSVKAEVASITAETLLTYPYEQAISALTLTVRQFFTSGIGDSTTPLKSWLTKWIISTRAPWLLDAFQSARQQNGGIDVGAWSSVAQPLDIGAALLLPLLVVGLTGRRDRRGAAFAAMIFVGLVGNAALCGFFSGVNNRYQARVDWIAPLAVVISAARFRQRGVKEVGSGKA